MRERLNPVRASSRASSMAFAMVTALSAGTPAPSRPAVASFVIHRGTPTGGTADRTFFAGATGQVSNTESLVFLTVKGPLLDLSTGADIVDATGVAVSGSSASIDRRQGGDNTQIDVFVSGLAGKAPGDYRMRIHYAVETNGPDVVKLRLLAHGNVTSIIRDPSPAGFGGAYTPLGPTYTLRVSGSGLNVATVEPSRVAGMNFVLVSRANTSLVFTIQPTQAGQYVLPASAFYDENLGHVPTTTDEAELGVRYTGTAAMTITAAGAPVVTSVTPQPASASGFIALTGANLLGSGLELHRILYGHRYSAGTDALTRASSVNAGSFSAFTTSASMLAAYDIASQPLQLEFLPEASLGGSSGGAPAYTLSVPFAATYPPAISDVIASAEQATVAGVRVLRAGTVTFTGKYLFAPPTVSKGDMTGVSAFTSSPPMPVVSLGGVSLPVTLTRYVAPSAVADGRDSVRVTLPDPADNVSGQFHLETGSGGAITPGTFVLATRPHVTVFAELTDAVSAEQVVTTQTLIRGKQYQITGTSLSLKNGTQIVQAGTVRLNTRAMTMGSTTDPSVQLRFLVPLDATAGALVVSTLGGETTIGTFTVVDGTQGAVATPRPTSVTIAPFTVAAGVSATGSVTLDNPGASVAGFTVALSSSDTSAASVPATLAVSSTSGSFTIVTKTVTAPRTVTIAATSGGATQSHTFTITPPIPTTFALSSPDVVAGTTVTGTLTFTAATPGTIVTMASSDAAAPVPASVTSSGSSATFSIVTTEAPAPRTVTITATANGVAKSATVTVTPLRIVSLSTTRDTIRLGQPASITANLNRGPAATEQFTVATSQPSVLQFAKPFLLAPGGQASGTIDLRVVAAPAAPTSVTLTISRSVVTAAFGTITTTATRNVLVVP